MEEKKKIKKTYRNDKITVVWQPDMCTHSKEFVIVFISKESKL